ncbi:IS3 family transposase [Roseateles sp. LYH14W]|uniref:IS3 family transposase n=1 Tax=Pelomonas parva TaxID=3299032 RepID=A0ABW7F1K3_9BURK
MTCTQQRQTLLTLILEARTAGARLVAACAQIGLSARTVQRWRHPDQCSGDRRVAGLHEQWAPTNKLSEAECETAMAVLNGDEFKNLPPSQIVPRLADQGRYVGSESTLYRLLHRAGQMRHRRLERAPQKRTKPRALTATQPNQIFCWDITYLPTCVRGVHFYLYLFVDLFSRKIVGWQVFDCESAELGAGLLQDICARQGIAAGQLVVHSDNGSPMKGETMLATMQKLGVAPSRSRPSVSNDNPYSEALFRTLKYRPELPVKPFENLLQARRWATELARWYNEEHRHSAIGFVTPSQRHEGQDVALLANRAAVYEVARRANPHRWSRQTRDWSYVDQVHLNPEKPNIQEANAYKEAA